MNIIIYVSEDKLIIPFEPQIYSELLVCHGTVIGTSDIRKRALTLTFPWRTLQSVVEVGTKCCVDTSLPGERGWKYSESERMSKNLIQGKTLDTEGNRALTIHD